MEIVRSPSGLRMYLNILFLKALPCSEDFTRTKVTIDFTEEETFYIYPQILEGGQRLLISQEDSDYLIQALVEDRSFTIKIGRYQTTIVPAAFSKVYKELMNLSIAEGSS